MSTCALIPTPWFVLAARFLRPACTLMGAVHFYRAIPSPSILSRESILASSVNHRNERNDASTLQGSGALWCEDPCCASAGESRPVDASHACAGASVVHWHGGGRIRDE
ncbi:hypothetical protein B0H13DRAFT_2096193 [Mycena leptocephala]|nr:hypothetical protein B0H13DRAFT_2122252 [Mycena leptocephala]KAJ7844719.1 hypothetical protein B0H13DRAFT_2096193 [Mycena leptocephala]